MKKFIFVSGKKWHDETFESLSNKFSGQWTRICKSEDFSAERIKQLNPDWIFIPHWSHIIPSEIYDNYNCVVFHMTDLPYGRGGSPLQNLIVNGHEKTKISAIKVSKGLDTGPIYLKKELSLLGTAREIFYRSAVLIQDMIINIIENNISPIEQIGEITTFKRRKPQESDISSLSGLKEVYDYIRMLDCDGYPNAYIETENLKFEFSDAKNNEKYITANVRITKK